MQKQEIAFSDEQISQKDFLISYDDADRLWAESMTGNSVKASKLCNSSSMGFSSRNKQSL